MDDPTERFAAGEACLEVADLRTQLVTPRGAVRAVDGVSFRVDRGQMLGIVGESGCGKSMTALSIMGLVPRPGRTIGGAVRFMGRDLTNLSERELEDVRGRHISMIFQDPLSALNPSLTVGKQITETLRRHLGLTSTAARARAIELLEQVRMPRAARHLEDHPHRLSGGMRQRVMIAIAIACTPEVLIADEPTTALDVTIQAQILELLDDLRREHRMAVVLITHDMGVVAEVADEVAVMYAGQIVEQADAVELFERPEHPYTEALLGALPQIERPDVRHGRLTSIAGRPPDLVAAPAGCRFAPRCRYAGGDACGEIEPPLREIRPGHTVRSLHPASERTGAGAA